MRFGLHAATATFLQLMDRVLQPHEAYADACISYIIIYSEGCSDHIRPLTGILRVLKEAQLTANLTKCHLATKEVSYLGCTVGGGQLQPLVGKIQALADSVPSTKKQVCHFLWFGGTLLVTPPKLHYHHCTFDGPGKGFGAPKICWTKSCDEALKSLKNCLSQEPVLFHLDFMKSFIVQTNISDVGLGTVLSQEFREGCPVLFLRRRLFPPAGSILSHQKRGLVNKMGC